MERTCMWFLEDWLNSYHYRRPLFIGGARGVGKTWLVREFAKQQNLELIELNLEKDPSLKSCFASIEPEEFLLELASRLKREIDPERSIVFIDEPSKCDPMALEDAA